MKVTWLTSSTQPLFTPDVEERAVIIAALQLMAETDKSEVVTRTLKTFKAIDDAIIAMTATK